MYDIKDGKKFLMVLKRLFKGKEVDMNVEVHLDMCNWKTTSTQKKNKL